MCLKAILFPLRFSQVMWEDWLMGHPVESINSLVENHQKSRSVFGIWPAMNERGELENPPFYII